MALAKVAERLRRAVGIRGLGIRSYRSSTMPVPTRLIVVWKSSASAADWLAHQHLRLVGLLIGAELRRHSPCFYPDMLSDW